MNNKFKKGALALGTIATIAAPVAAVVSCGTVNTIDYDAKANYQPGQTWEEFINSLDGMGLKDKSLLNKGEYQASYILYEQEVKDSINSQIDSFNYEYYTKTNQLTDLNALTDGLKAKVTAATTDEDKKSTQAALDAHNKKIGDLEKDKTDLETKLDELIKLGNGEDSKIDYKSNTLSSDYPLLQLPTDQIAEGKQSYLDDAKENFITQFDTRSEGEAKWPEERSTKFNGATSDTEAVDFLVNQSIATKAMSKYKFEINSSYNLEQYIFARTIGNGTFSFLNTNAGLVKYNTKYNDTKDATGKLAIIDTINNENGSAGATPEEIATAKIKVLHDWVKANPTKATSKVFFISSQAENKVWWNAFSDLSTPSEIIEVKHALITGKRDADHKNPWAIAQADIEKLFTTINDGTSTIMGYKAIQDVRLFDDKDFTDAVLHHFVTSDGSSDNGGSLGFNTVLGYVKSMVEGFGLGVLADTDTTNVGDGTTAMNSFSTKMEAALYDALLAIGIDKTTFDGTTSIADKNEDVKRALTYMGADKIKTIFGSIFRDTLDGTKHLVSSFGTSTNKNLFVISSFGVHIIQIDAGKKADDEVAKDIQALADEDYKTSKTGIASLINNQFTQIQILSTLLADDDDKKALKEKFEESLKKENSEITDAEIKTSWDAFTTLVDQSLKSQNEQNLQTSLGTKISTWYVGQLDDKILDGKLSPADLYKLADDKKGVN